MFSINLGKSIVLVGSGYRGKIFGNLKVLHINE